MHEGVVKHELRGCCVFGLKLQWRNVLCFWSHFSQETIFVHLRFLLPGKIRAILWNVDYKSVINIKVNYTHVSLDMAIQYVSWKTSDQSKSQTFSNLYLITIWTHILSCGSGIFHYTLMWAQNSWSKSTDHLCGWLFVWSHLLGGLQQKHLRYWSLGCTPSQHCTPLSKLHCLVEPIRPHSVSPTSHPAKSGLTFGERRLPQRGWYLTASSGQCSCAVVHVTTSKRVM